MRLREGTALAWIPTPMPRSTRVRARHRSARTHRARPRMGQRIRASCAVLRRALRVVAGRTASATLKSPRRPAVREANRAASAQPRRHARPPGASTSARPPIARAAAATRTATVSRCSAIPNAAPTGPSAAHAPAAIIAWAGSADAAPPPIARLTKRARRTTLVPMVVGRPRLATADAATPRRACAPPVPRMQHAGRAARRARTARAVHRCV